MARESVTIDKIAAPVGPCSAQTDLMFKNLAR